MPRIASYLALALFLSYGNPSLAHEAPGHLDPDLLSGWLTWLHLTIQWVHLISFALWLGLTAGTLTFGLNPPLDRLLYSSWVLLLILLATGTYNMEWSSGIPETPSLLMLPLLAKIPYGVTYTLTLAIKVGLYGLAVLLTLVITALHVTRSLDESGLTKAFLICGTFIGILLTLAAAVVLFYHEAADLWPTKIHSLGGVLGPEGARGQIDAGLNSPPPNDFGLLRTPQAWIDIGLRWIHLLGFGLLLGGMVIGAFFKDVSTTRFLWYVWILLTIQILSGIGNMARWTPFDPAPYIWNLQALSHVRFGRVYTSLMAVKHGLVLLTIGLSIAATVLHRRHGRDFSARGYALAAAVAALVISYIMMMVLLLHEGVDHAL